MTKGKELFSHRINNNICKVVLLIVLLLVFILLPRFGGNFLTHVVLEMFFLAFLGQAWNIFSGYCGELSFGHATFFGVGAYTSSILLMRYGISPWIGMLVGGCFSALLGIGIAYISLRYNVKGVFFALATLACAELMRLLSLTLKSLTNGAEGILIPFKGENFAMFSFGVNKKYIYYYIILGMFILCSLVAYKVKKSRLGYHLSAIKGNYDAAKMLGINTLKCQIIAMGISTFLTAMGGTFYAQYYQHFEPDVLFSANRSFEIIFPVILGGGGYIAGPLVGAIILQGFEIITRELIPSFMYGVPKIVSGLILVIMMMFIPGGVVSSVYKRVSNIRLKRKEAQEGR